MRCDEFEHILEQELTDPYPETAAAHLEGCEPCRKLATELSAIRMGGHVLGEQDAEELEAPEHIWSELRRQLLEEGLIRKPAVKDYSRPSWWSALRRPAFAGAAVLLLAVAGLLVGSQSSIAPELAEQVRPARPAASAVTSRSSTGPGEATPAGVSDQLETDLDETVAGLPQQDALLVNSLRRDMDLIDSSIAMCEKSVREQPGNEIAREYLYGAYEQKAELLGVALNRSITGGLQ